MPVFFFLPLERLLRLREDNVTNTVYLWSRDKIYKLSSPTRASVWPLGLRIRYIYKHDRTWNYFVPDNILSKWTAMMRNFSQKDSEQRTGSDLFSLGTESAVGSPMALKTFFAYLLRLTSDTNRVRNVR